MIFVKEVGAKDFSNICLLVGRVSHSRKLSETPPTAWVIDEMGGKKLSAHCNCMAGEACSHIGAILFIVGLQPRKDSVTVTGEKAYWVLLSNQEVSCKEVCNIDFICPKEVPSSTPTEIELQELEVQFE